MTYPTRAAVEEVPDTPQRRGAMMRRICRACLGLGKTVPLDDCSTCGGCGYEHREATRAETVAPMRTPFTHD